eukprot:5237297-Amphidinium_carterae.1
MHATAEYDGDRLSISYYVPHFSHKLEPFLEELRFLGFPVQRWLQLCRPACLAAQIENHAAECEDEDADDLSAPAAPAPEPMLVASRNCQSTSVPSSMSSRFRSSTVRWNTEPEQDASVSATSYGLGVGMDTLDRAVAAPMRCSDRHHTPTLGLVGSWTG